MSLRDMDALKGIPTSFRISTIPGLHVGPGLSRQLMAEPVMNVDEIRIGILGAREKRAALREQYAQIGRDSISLSLNIPGYPKSTPLLSGFFNDVLQECKQFLQAHRIAIDTTQEVRQIDEAGDFYLAPIFDGQPLVTIKALTESFEGRHPLGRIIDIDIADRRFRPVSSEKLKPCMLCEQPAIVCMREANHTYEELREHLVLRIRGYLADKTRQQICKQLASLALKAILYEISLSPKPGLVGRFEKGAHQDMDYFTFLDSTSVLAGYFEEIALSGYLFYGDDLREALPLIRTVGLKMEASMFSATDGVNTQKGLIFLIGLSLFSAAYSIARDRTFALARGRDTIKAICANLVQKELRATASDEKTHGKICFQRYGLEGAGVRKEAEDGLPSVFERGLQELKSALAGSDKATASVQMNRALIKTLLRLISVTNDTNILHRKDMQILKTVQHMAQQTLDAWNGEAEAERYEKLLDYCQRENVSPGGSADLLAVTVFLYFVENSFSTGSKFGNTE
jgi:holo-ACP synthase / triphosphoribosyl-dephospho-CoA synthase